MKNFIESGDVMDVTLAAAMEPGDIIVVGNLFGVLVNGGAVGDTVAAKRTGVFTYPKTSSAFAQGDKVYLKSDENALTGTATGNKLIGYAWRDAAAGDAEVVFVLDR